MAGTRNVIIAGAGIGGLTAALTLARESPLEHKLNVAFSLLLIATVVGLWIWFR